MNSWQIEWDLSVPKQEAINLLHDIIQFPEGRQPSHKKFKSKGKISGSNFEFTIKRSLIWGTAFRKEIEGKGSVTALNSGSRISANFEVCSPYKYVNLNSKNLGIIIPIFILSWVGLIFTMIYPEKLDFLNYILVPSFFITCFILLIGFQRYLTINDKFKEVRNSFEKTFSKYRMNES